MSHLHEEGVAANLTFYATSIYDHTIYEACSRVIQRLVTQVPACSELLDMLVAHCGMEKAFLIDVFSKTFIATDSSFFDPFNYELCTDMIDLVIEISCIYGQRGPQPTSVQDGQPHAAAALPAQNTEDQENGRTERSRDLYNAMSAKRLEMGGDDSGTASSTTEGESRQTIPSRTGATAQPSPIDAVNGSASASSGARDTPASPTTATIKSGAQSKEGNPVAPGALSIRSGGRSGRDGSPSTTMCLIQLNTGHILYLHEIDRLVALACVVREENFDRQYLVDYNIRIFCGAIKELFRGTKDIRNKELLQQRAAIQVQQLQQVPLVPVQRESQQRNPQNQAPASQQR
eukprot:GHVT01032800.1.p1 GENE.GHVT01032800.1~~GHVT01032800.1.p1  ORF type:complete len:346 (-),score=35.72 GHVT01032800.1:415-1452(-)